MVRPVTVSSVTASQVTVCVGDGVPGGGARGQDRGVMEAWAGPGGGGGERMRAMQTHVRVRVRMRICACACFIGGRAHVRMRTHMRKRTHMRAFEASDGRRICGPRTSNARSGYRRCKCHQVIYGDKYRDIYADKNIRCVW